MKIFKFGVVALFILLNGCSSKKSDIEYKTISEYELFEQGKKEVQSGNFKEAVKTLTKLENEYPASDKYLKLILIMQMINILMQS